jgi:hypothetical protein
MNTPSGELPDPGEPCEIWTAYFPCSSCTIQRQFTAVCSSSVIGAWIAPGAVLMPLSSDGETPGYDLLGFAVDQAPERLRSWDNDGKVRQLLAAADGPVVVEGGEQGLSLISWAPSVPDQTLALPITMPTDAVYDGANMHLLGVDAVGALVHATVPPDAAGATVETVVDNVHFSQLMIGKSPPGVTYSVNVSPNEGDMFIHENGASSPSPFRFNSHPVFWEGQWVAEMIGDEFTIEPQGWSFGVKTRIPPQLVLGARLLPRSDGLWLALALGYVTRIIKPDPDTPRDPNSDVEPFIVEEKVEEATLQLINLSRGLDPVAEVRLGTLVHSYVAIDIIASQHDQFTLVASTMRSRDPYLTDHHVFIIDPN